MGRGMSCTGGRNSCKESVSVPRAEHQTHKTGAVTVQLRERSGQLASDCKRPTRNEQRLLSTTAHILSRFSIHTLIKSGLRSKDWLSQRLAVPCCIHSATHIWPRRRFDYDQSASKLALHASGSRRNFPNGHSNRRRQIHSPETRREFYVGYSRIKIVVMQKFADGTDLKNVNKDGVAENERERRRKRV